MHLANVRKSKFGPSVTEMRTMTSILLNEENWGVQKKKVPAVVFPSRSKFRVQVANEPKAAISGSNTLDGWKYDNFSRLLIRNQKEASLSIRKENGS